MSPYSLLCLQDRSLAFELIGDVLAPKDNIIDLLVLVHELEATLAVFLRLHCMVYFDDSAEAVLVLVANDQHEAINHFLPPLHLHGVHF